MTIENAKTTIINLDDEDNRVILVIFNSRKYADTERHTAEVYTTYKEYGVINYQFGVAFDYGNEQDVIDMVIGNYLNNNLFWEERIDDEEYKETTCLYDGGSLDDKEIVKTIKEAADDYEGGAILEAHDKLLAVVDAIAEFNNDYSDD